MSLFNGISTEDVDRGRGRADACVNQLAERIWRDVYGAEQMRDGEIRSLEHAQEQVLGPNRQTAEHARFISREEQRASSRFVITLKHLVSRRRTLLRCSTCSVAGPAALATASPAEPLAAHSVQASAPPCRRV